MAGVVLYPFKVSTLAWESRPGKWNLTICLKATYRLAGAEEPELASQQDGIHEEIHFDQAPLASLYSPSDYVAFKPRVDVLLVGNAYAPGGVEAHNLMVRLAVGDIAKALRVSGDRSWAETPRGPRASLPRPFTRMPLRYERSVHRGDNVVGAVRGDATRPPPNIDIAAEDGPDETPGFGPIAPSWRAQADPTVQEAMLWASRLRSSHRAGVPPFGMKIDVFNTAPRDQQLNDLPPATRLELEHLHPRVPRLATRTPSIVPTVFHVDPGKGEPSEVVVRADTLWIDTDHEVLVMSWRGVTGIAAPEVLGVGTVLVAARPPETTVTFQEVQSLVLASRAARSAVPTHRAPATLRIERAPDKTAPFPMPPAPASAEPIARRPPTSVPTMQLPILAPFREETPATGTPLAPHSQSLTVPQGPTPKRVPPTLDLDGAQPLAPDAAAPFSLASPGSMGTTAPISGAPWAAEPALPVPKPSDDDEDTLPVGAALVAFIQPLAASSAPKKVPRTLDLEGPGPIVPSAAPFPLASPGSTASAEPLAGAPWAPEPASPVPPPSPDQRETLPMGGWLADLVANAGPDEAAGRVAVVPPPPLDVVPVPEADPPPQRTVTSPSEAAPAPPPDPPTRAVPEEVVWRVDPPAPPVPTQAPVDRSARQVPDLKSVFYSAFAARKR